MDRIKKLEELDAPYQPSEIDWEDYFYNIVGVTRLEGEPEEIKLLFHEGGDYVKTKPLHATQKFKETPYGLEVRIKVVPNFELEKLILSFGRQVEVVAPRGLRDKIKADLSTALHHYS